MINDFKHVLALKNVTYKIDSINTQFITMNDSRGNVIRLTIPDDVFEWFVDVYDKDGKQLHSDRNDHYGSPTDTLKHERETDIDRFITAIQNGTLAFAGTSLLDEFYKATP